MSWKCFWSKGLNKKQIGWEIVGRKDDWQCRYIKLHDKQLKHPGYFYDGSVKDKLQGLHRSAKAQTGIMSLLKYQSPQVGYYFQWLPICAKLSGHIYKLTICITGIQPACKLSTWQAYLLQRLVNQIPQERNFSSLKECDFKSFLHTTGSARNAVLVGTCLSFFSVKGNTI